jgi:hypothetical protein
MNSTSSRSVKDTPKTEDVPDTSGTPPTGPSSEPISESSTTWTVVSHDGVIRQLVLPGDGRISYMRSEVRVYRDQKTKTYDAVVTNVTEVFSHRVEVRDMGKTTVAIAAEEAREAWAKRRAEAAAVELADRMITGKYKAFGSLLPAFEEEEPDAL